LSRFEVKATDLLGRVGRLHTRHGALETPALLPVVHPINQEIDLNTIKKIGFKAVMTNAYITLKRIGEEAAERGIHSIIGFDGIIMTDSGGYQVLEYGEVDVTPAKMTTFQEEIGSDIAVVLDRPTGFSRNRAFAEQTLQQKPSLRRTDRQRNTQSSQRNDRNKEEKRHPLGRANPRRPLHRPSSGKR